MRTSTKYSLAFVITAFVVYLCGYLFIPEQLNSDREKYTFTFFAASYFVVLPLLYWRWAIVKGKKKAWKLLLILSLSSLFARSSFPADFAKYFEFIAWLRYPLIAIALLAELALMSVVIKGLWQARRLSGDPRIHAIANNKDKNDMHRDIALWFAYEPTNWYYAIPYFSREHTPALTSLKLWSSSAAHFFVTIAALLALTVGSYELLVGWSYVTAIVVSSIIGYSIIMVVANYRISRHYSVYVMDETLVINANILNFMAVKLGDIAAINTGTWLRDDDPEVLQLGSGKKANVELVFNSPQDYHGLMGMNTDSHERIRLIVDDAEKLKSIAQKQHKTTMTSSDTSIGPSVGCVS